MGVTLLVLAIVIESVFTIWTIVTKESHSLEKAVIRTGSSILLVVLLVFGILDGFMRYGMFVFVLLLQSGIGYFAFCKKKRKTFSRGRQIVKWFGNTILYSIVLFVAILFPQYEKPDITGNLEVLTKNFTWVDESRVETYTDTGENRSITIKVWYPKEAGSYPLVVFSHGAFGVIDSNTSTCTELASNGYVVVSIAHPYQAAYVKDTNGKITIGSTEFLNEMYQDNGTDTIEGEERNYKQTKKWMEIRTGDENFVLDTILEKAKKGDNEPFDRINVDEIGLFGHSLGGASSVEIGRQRDDIGAVIDLEGTMFGEYLDFKDGVYEYNQEPYPVPLLDVNSREVYDLAMQLKKQDGVLYVNFYMGENAKDFHEVVINGISHLNMTDLGMISPILSKLMCAGTSSSGTATVDSRACIENINFIVLNFFDYYLKDSGEWNIESEY